MNTFGTIFRVSIFGESHGEEIGVVLDGVAPGISLDEKDFAADIARRRSGARGTTPRVEADEPRILSGVFGGCTTGAPLTIVFRNTNTHSQDYEALRGVPRPGHADYMANVKFSGFQDPRGGGHFSGRLTLPVVAAGVVAKKILSNTLAAATGGRVQFQCRASVTEIGGVSRQEAEARAGGSLSDADLWGPELDRARQEGDSLGGVVECVVDTVPAGLGEPFWDSLESRLSHAVFAIPGVRGVEFGDGFAASRMKGSEHNDCYVQAGHHHCHHQEGDEGCCHGEGHCSHDGAHEGCCHRNRFLTPATNHAGGVNGGITNGNPLVFRVAFKPTSSIAKAQETFDFARGEMTTLRVGGRHDTCFALRTPVIVEAMASIVLADLLRLA